VAVTRAVGVADNLGEDSHANVDAVAGFVVGDGRGIPVSPEIDGCLGVFPSWRQAARDGVVAGSTLELYPAEVAECAGFGRVGEGFEVGMEDDVLIPDVGQDQLGAFCAQLWGHFSFFSKSSSEETCRQV